MYRMELFKARTSLSIKEKNNFIKMIVFLLVYMYSIIIRMRCLFSRKTKQCHEIAEITEDSIYYKVREFAILL